MSAPALSRHPADDPDDHTQPQPQHDRTEYVRLSDIIGSPGRAVPPEDGQIIYLPPHRHTCTPPTRAAETPAGGFRRGDRLPQVPDAPDGAIWECHCGKAHTAVPAAKRWPQGARAHRRWRRATWSERRRARAERALAELRAAAIRDTIPTQQPKPQA